MSDTALTREYTQDWATEHFPLWRRVLAPLIGGARARMLEVGAFEGRSACFFLEEILTGEGATLTCVDPWAGWDDIMARFDANTADAQADGKLVKVRARSSKIPELELASFDAIYIDGDHSPEAVLSDAAWCWPLLEPGGVLIFDDYGLADFGTALGVDTFLRVAGDRVEVLERGWQVIVRKLEGAAELPGLICPLHSEAHRTGQLCGAW